MEIITECNNVPVLVTPLMHREVIRCRAPEYLYPAVLARIERDRPAIDAFRQRIHPFAHHPNLDRLGRRASAPGEPFWGNRWFDGGDARAAYGIVAALAPARIIEIGSGNSTMFIRRALKDFNLPCQLTSIDPAPRAEIDALCDTVIRRSVLEVDLDLFGTLRAGDILFHDGSHLTFNGTDTVRLFLEILPQLAPGVLVHIHDICLPYEYIKAFDRRGYSEQYMLAAALLFADQFEVLLPVALLARQGCFEGGVSFWLRKRPQPVTPPVT